MYSHPYKISINQAAILFRTVKIFISLQFSSTIEKKITIWRQKGTRIVSSQERVFYKLNHF
jgi:hypothetical protein